MGNERKGRMIWDAIDMIMPLRGLLALSCLDLSWETYMLGKLAEVLRHQGDLPYKIINSTALPNVTFISAPMVSPILLATLSVA
jgi:hypothetical protein